MISSSEFSVRFWGVRGSIACPGPGTTRYGGNTPCVEIRCGDRLIILDAGTGIRELGNVLLKSGKPIEADILLTHCHYDHVIGIPFFAPLFLPKHKFRFWCGNLSPEFKLKPVMQTLMSEPLFPIGVEIFRADIDYRDFQPGDTIPSGDGISIRTAPLNHPGGATGYRIDYRGRSVVYLTDHEGRREDLNKKLVAFAERADLMIYDTTYTEDEIEAKKGWGHSTWQDGARLADAARVKTFCLFHHAPEHDDEAMDKTIAEARAQRPGTIAAMENTVIDL